ncbi:MAG: PAS domain-containing sensor histidine kinase [Alphaproteobacteria bacterium]
MFSLRRKKPKNHTAQGSLPFASAMNDRVPRIAINENGKIVFASDSFLTLSARTPETTKNEDFWAILRFSEHILEPHKIESGIHSITIDGHQNTLAFHFDWLETRNNQKFLIGSLAQESTEPASPPKVIQNTPQIEVNDTETLLALSHEIMLVLDTNGRILRTNPKFQSVLGYTSEDTNTLTFQSLFEEEERPFIRSTLQDAQERVIDFETRLNAKDKKPRWVKWRIKQVHDALYCTGRDTTAIKAQESALQKREKQLSQAESLGRMGHWRWELDNDNIEWSTEIYNIFGVENGSFEPSLMSMTHMIDEDDVDRLTQSLQRAIIEENDYDVEFQIHRPDGQTRHIRSEGRCSRNESGEVTALFGIMQDMTERMEYERDLKTAKDESERAYAAKSQFLANMSHELRTPLNAIIGFSEMIERQLLGPIGTEKYLDYIKGIRESGEHLLDMISDILDMSKIEAGKYELMLEELNPAKTIQLAIHMMEGRALEDGIKITADLDETTQKNIVADRRALLQIILNLMSNAVKFSKENGEITATYRVAEDGIAIQIKDNGIGIPANKLANITRPFEQVSASYTRDHDGSGLGLAITKELTELHGGSLSIESTVHVGTCVTIRLPFEPPPENT